jgi:hypothetical protein
MTIIATPGMKLHPDYENGKAEYRVGYMDAINEEPRKKQAPFMYNAGYDQGQQDWAAEKSEI